MDVTTEQAFINKQIGAAWLDLEYHIAWHGGYILDQVVCRRGDDGWVTIIKASRGRKAYVSFVGTRTLGEGVELAGELASRGVLEWAEDRYPSLRVKTLTGHF